mgnify:CR=1 FL=1
MSQILYPTTRALWPEEISFGLRSNVLVNIQASLGAEFRRVVLPGSRWVCDMQYNACSLPDLAEREAFFAEVEGQANDVMMWHPNRENPRGTFVALTNSLARAQTTNDSDQLYITNGPPFSTLLKGDMFSAGEHLFMVKEAANLQSDGSGFARVAPKVRESFTASPIISSRPTARFVSAEPLVMIPSNRRSGLEFAVRWVEIFNA